MRLQARLRSAPGSDTGLRLDERDYRARLPLVLLGVAILVGGALRLYDVGELPRGFNQDEAVYSYDAWSLARSGRDHLGHPFNLIGFETYGDWTPPLHTILLTPAAALFGLDITALRAWSALLALLIVPLMYLLGTVLLKSPWAGVLAAWLIAISPWHIAQSRMVHPIGTYSAVAVLFVLTLTYAAKRQSGGWIVASSVACIGGIAAYQSLRVYFPILIFAAAVAWWRRYLAIHWRYYVIGGAIVAIVAVPTMLFLFLDSAGGSRMQEVSVFNENSFYLPAGTVVDARFVIEQYLDYFGPAFLLREGGEYYPWILPRNVGVIPLALAIFMAVGAVWACYRVVRPVDAWQRSTSVFLLIALAGYPIAGALTLPGPSAPRVIAGLPIIILVAVFGVHESARAAHGCLAGRPKNVRLGVPIVAGFLFALLLVTQTAQHLDSYFARYGDETGFDFHYGLKEALAFAEQNKSIYNEVWVAHVNEPYIYLLFDNEIDPELARRNMLLQRNPGLYNWVTEYENYRFTSRVWFDPPADINVADMTTVFQTFHPDGEVAYEVRTGEVPGKGLVMVIFRPQWIRGMPQP